MIFLSELLFFLRLYTLPFVSLVVGLFVCFALFFVVRVDAFNNLFEKTSKSAEELQAQANPQSQEQPPKEKLQEVLVEKAVEQNIPPLQVQEAKKPRYVVTVKLLKIRSKPDINSKVVGYLNKDSVLNSVTEENSDWVKIQQGWVFKKFLKISDA